MSDTSRVITFFCLYINRQDKHTQYQFKDFFVRELATNAHNNQDWAVDVLMKLNDKKLTDSIYHIFCKSIVENNPRKGRIFLLLITLKDDASSHVSLYYDFVEKEVKQQIFLYQDAFSLNLLVKYLAINHQHSLNILSDYYAKFISVTTQRNESNIFIPCLFFSKNSCEYMKDLITMTYLKNQQSGIHLKKLFTDYAKYCSVENKEEWNNMQNMILQLNSIVLSE
jgi:hypothetical protein